MTEPVPFRRMRDLPPEMREKSRLKSRELKNATQTILDVFSSRMPTDRITSLRQHQYAGEWSLMFDEVCAILVKRRVPLTLAERDLVARTLEAFGPNPGPDWHFLAVPDEVLAGLTVLDDEGNPISPPPGFDAENWWPRHRATSRWGRVGGHLHDAGIPYKTTFPAGWDARKLNAVVLDVARNPDEVPEQDRNGGWITRGTRENVQVEVRLRPDGGIAYGYPLSGLGVHHTGTDGHPTSPRW